MYYSLQKNCKCLSRTVHYVLPMSTSGSFPYGSLSKSRPQGVTMAPELWRVTRNGPEVHPIQRAAETRPDSDHFGSVRVVAIRKQKNRCIVISIYKPIDTPIYRRYCPILFLRASLISIQNIEVSSGKYRYCDISISYRPSLAMTRLDPL